MNSAQRRRVSKLLSRILRHSPDSVGLTLDAGGWVAVEALLQAMSNHGAPISQEDLAKVVATNTKQRFSLSEDKMRIRANYGHSIPAKLNYEPAEPPEILFHGTTTANLESIRTAGLRPQGRRFVHLTETPDQAVAVGRRHGEPYVISVMAGKMHEAGHIFYCTPGSIWLVRSVPPEFIEFDSDFSQSHF